MNKTVQICAVTAICLFVGSSALFAQNLEDQQASAGAIVKAANALAKKSVQSLKADEKTVATQGYVRVADLLKDASPDAKLQFLDSLVVVDGKVSSVSVEKLTKEMGQAKVRSLLLELFPAPVKPLNMTDGVRATGLCDEHYCYGAACTGSSSHHYCAEKPNGACGGGC